ncbi:MAG: hypothetical protein ACOYKK_06035 [Microbacteriaceae bacterium]
MTRTNFTVEGRRGRLTALLLVAAVLATGTLSGCAPGAESTATGSSQSSVERRAGEKSTRLCIRNNSSTEFTASFNRFDGINGDPNADYVVGLTAKGGQVCADGWYSSPPDVSVGDALHLADGHKSFSLKRNSDAGFIEFQLEIDDSSNVTQLYDCSDSYYG